MSFVDRRKRFTPRRGSKVLVVRKPFTKAEQALKIAKRNRRELNEFNELLSIDVAISESSLQPTPTILYLGGAQNGVEGFSYTLKSVSLKGVIKHVSAITDDYRIDLVIDRAPNKITLTPLEYLDNVAPTIWAFKSFGAKSRFRIIKTWSGHLDEVGGANNFIDINYYKRLNIKVDSDEADSFAPGQVIRNALYLVRWSTATTNFPTFEGNVRIVHSD